MIAVVIPARLASTRFPGKPLALINGKPMIVRVWERAREIKADLVMVATDDDTIADVIQGEGGNVMMTSPDHQSGADRIAEACRNLPENALVLNVQGDLPFFRPEVGEALIRALESDSEADMATPVIPVDFDVLPSSRNIVKVVFDCNHNALYFSRAVIPFVREFPDQSPMFYRHIGVYCYRNSALQRFAALKQSRLEQMECLEQLRALENGMKIKCVVVDKDCGIEINSPKDLQELNNG